MILKQNDSICYHTDINVDLLKIKEMCYKNSYLGLTIFELFRDYVVEKKVSFDYSWMQKDIVMRVKSLDKSAMDDFKEHLPAYLEYAFKDFLAPDILKLISVHGKQRIKYEEEPTIVAHFKSGMNACRLEQDLSQKSDTVKKMKL